MFKAFTNNISSFIGGGEKPPAENVTDNLSEVKDNTKTDGQLNDGGESPNDTGRDSSDTQTAASTEQSSHNSGEVKGSKVPPPRPNPPLTPATSLCKQDTLPESETQGQGQSELSTAKTGDEKDPSSPGSGEADGADSTAQDGQQKDKIDEKLDEVAEKAREWGNYFFSITKSAGASVTAKARELKKVVAENTIIGDFAKEQDKFVSEKKEKARANEAAVPPWVGYNEEEQMKTQMLTLSNDKRNFLRNPPTGVQFHFDYDTCYPVAMATLAEDERLQEMRFKLVPKQVSEHDFWRNYFYRVSLIKQSTQLTSLARMSTAASPESTAQADQAASETKDTTVQQGKKSDEPSSEAAPTDMNDGGNDDSEAAGGADEFISDAYNLEISDEDLMREMEALRASPGADDQEWEDELQKELTDYEVVGDANEIDDAALEKEIMKEMTQKSD